MNIKHKYLNLSPLSVDIGLSPTTLPTKVKGIGYQKVTELNKVKIRPKLHDMNKSIHEIDSVEAFEIYVESFGKHLGYR